MRLRRNEFCPIHKSVSCCGREHVPKPRLIRLGVQRVEDPHHPRGYRELQAPAEVRKLLNRKIVEQDGECAICHKEFTHYNDIVPDHTQGDGRRSSSQAALRPPGPLRTGHDSFPVIRLKHFKRLQEDAVWRQKDVDGGPCYGTRDGVARGSQHWSSHPTSSGRSNAYAIPWRG